MLAADYFADRSVAHTAQGDIHTGVIPSFAALLSEPVKSTGARKRTSRTEDQVSASGEHCPVLVCSYTCGFTAQPPGTQGYSHPWRVVAPIVTMSFLKRNKVSNNDLNKLKDAGRLSGLMYLPAHADLGLRNEDDKFAGHAAALLYRPSLVTQDVLDASPKVLRLSEAAQRILAVTLIGVFSPNSGFDPDDPNLKSPDMTDSWA